MLEDVGICVGSLIPWWISRHFQTFCRFFHVFTQDPLSCTDMQICTKSVYQIYEIPVTGIFRYQKVAPSHEGHHHFLHHISILFVAFFILCFIFPCGSSISSSFLWKCSSCFWSSSCSSWSPFSASSWLAATITVIFLFISVLSLHTITSALSIWQHFFISIKSSWIVIIVIIRIALIRPALSFASPHFTYIVLAAGCTFLSR